MPGNEPGDRVHNFFAQDLQFQGHQQSQAAQDRREDAYSSPFKHGPNFIQSNLRPHSVKNPNELQPNMNNFGYGNLFHQSGQNEESLLAMNISSRGLPFHGLQQGVPNNFTSSTVSSQTPLSSPGFDLFNGQQQTIHQQSSMAQFLHPQPSGTNDVQLLQQQLTSRRLQELQRQQQQAQLFDSRQQHSSVNQTTLVNGFTGPDMFQSPEDGTNWVYQSPPDLLGHQQNIIRTQQFDQSLYGAAPVSSSSRNFPAANDPRATPDWSSIPQSPISVSNSYHSDNQHNLLMDRAQIVPSKEEAALDPEEKMFLFSSGDSIHDAFGAISEESNIFGDGGFSNSLNGSWSALMQSAAAETSGNETPEEFGPNFDGNNGPVGSEQHFNSSLLQTSTAFKHQNQAGVSSGWNTMLNNPDAEKLKHNLQNRQAMQGSLGSLWRQNPGLSYDTDLGHWKTGHGKGINERGAQLHNPPRTVDANSFVHNTSLNQQSPHAYKEGGLFGIKDSRSPSPGRQNLSNLQLPAEVSAPRKFRYHPMGNEDENSINEHSLQQQSQARAVIQQNFTRSNLFNQTSMDYTVPKQGNSRELQVDAKGSKNKSPSHQQGFGLNLGPPSQRLHLSHNSQGGKKSSAHQMSTNISSGFVSGIPNSKNHFQSQHSTMQRVQTSQIRTSPFQNILESNSAPLMENTNHQSESVSTDRVQEVTGSVEKEMAVKSHFKIPPANSTSMPEQINDFGQSLRPSSFLDQPYSWKNQTQALRNADVDGSSKVKEGPKSLEDGNITSKDISVLDSTISQSLSYNGNAASARAEYHKGSHQMAPPSSYGSLKTGQVLQVPDAHKVDHTTRLGENISALGKSNALNSDEKGTSAPLVAPEISALDGHYPQPQLDVTGQHLVHLGHKKRKNDTFGLQPWHKEISDDSRPKSHSMGEADWSKSVKRVSGKVDDIAEPIEGATPVLRAKKRLMRSSRLMQQLIGPLPEIITSTDAISSCDVALYATSRIALGDACHAVSSASNLDVSSTNLNPPPERRKSLARNVAQRYEMASKELVDRATAVKEKLARLEESAPSLLDLRTQCQDLEKHTNLFRFLKMYVYGQIYNLETSSTITGTRKLSPERLIKAAPMTGEIPEDAKCLSL